jgi:hypothetical protein
MKMYHSHLSDFYFLKRVDPHQCWLAQNAQQLHYILFQHFGGVGVVSFSLILGEWYHSHLFR